MPYTVTSLERPVVKELAQAMQEALRSVERDYGVKISVGRASFGPNNAKYAIELSTIGDGGLIKSRHAEDFERYQYRHGLPLNLLNQTFVDPSGKTYKLVGYLPKSSRAPFLVENKATSRQYKMPEYSIRNGFKLPARRADALSDSEVDMERRISAAEGR